MSFFKKKEDFDIQCSNRTLKNLIDECYGSTASWADYEHRTMFLVEQCIKYRKLLNLIMDEAYEKHVSDYSCDIPDYKTFISEEKEMLKNRDEYKDKTICVEGYVSNVFRPFYPEVWNRDNAGVMIYPMPCRTEVEEKIINTLVADICATDFIMLVSDSPIEVESGNHIRVYGRPYFYKTNGGGTATKVHILVNKYEILE